MTEESTTPGDTALPSFDDIEVLPLDAEPRARCSVVERGGTRVLLVEAGYTGSAATWLAAGTDVWRPALEDYGAVLLRGFGVDTAAALVAATDVVFTAPYATKEHPRAVVEGRIVTPIAYPAERELLWHNEDSFNRTWPATLAFACARPAEVGGETTVVDGTTVLQGLDRGTRQRFERLGVRYVRRFHPGLGLPWQAVFDTDDRREVERICRREGAEFRWTGDVLVTSTHRPAVRSRDGGRAAWFAQVLHWHEACLDAQTREHLLCTVGETPRSCLFGDGSPIPAEVVEELTELSRCAEFAVRWRRGDVLFVDNRAMAHGRRPYRGDRQVLVALGDPGGADPIDDLPAVGG